MRTEGKLTPGRCRIESDEKHLIFLHDHTCINQTDSYSHIFNQFPSILTSIVTIFTLTCYCRYNFAEVIEWLAERVDRIILLFDAHKLDISDEFRRVIECMRGYDDKVRIVLNKADMVDHQQLMRVYGALMWCVHYTHCKFITFYF